MTYKLFIDDERDPVTNDWVIARTSDAAINLVFLNGMPTEIAFDHDLGGDDSARRFVYWLFNKALDDQLKIPDGFKFSVHSQNPIGAKWITDMMNDIITYSRI